MKNIRRCILPAFVLFIGLTTAGSAQEPEIALAEPRALLSATPLPGAPAPADEDEPGYRAYREAYSLILDERWAEARKKLAELLSKYPKSGYSDDANYWSAFALKHIDRAKAVAAYREFVKRYPKSRYFDDALADLNELDTRIVIAGVSVPVPRPPDRGIETPEPALAPTTGMAPNVKSLMRQFRRQTLQLSRTGFRTRHITTPFAPLESQRLDPQTQIKMDALYALGDTKEDEKSYQTLKEVALDQKQPCRLREAAMDALSNFKKFEVIPVFVEIARKDTSEVLQSVAVDFIREHGKEKNQTVSVLMDLFNTLPRERKDQREAIFYSIADVGNDKAVDFLSTVALTNDDYDFRRDAVYYLGSIGGDKAREALYKILQGK